MYLGARLLSALCVLTSNIIMQAKIVKKYLYHCMRVTATVAADVVCQGHMHYRELKF